MRTQENAAYEARYSWWYPARLCLATALFAALSTGGTIKVLLMPGDARARAVPALLTLVLALLALRALRRLPRALRLCLRREAAFAVMRDGVDIDPPARTPIPWERLAAIQIVTHHGRLGTGELPWTRERTGKRVYLLGPAEEGCPPLAWREIDGWRLDRRRLAAATARFKPALRVERVRVAARTWTPETLPGHLYWGDA